MANVITMLYRGRMDVANKTAYDLYNHPEQYLEKNVMEAICRVYNLRLGDLLESISHEEVQAS